MEDEGRTSGIRKFAAATEACERAPARLDRLARGKPVRRDDTARESACPEEVTSLAGSERGEVARPLDDDSNRLRRRSERRADVAHDRLPGISQRTAGGLTTQHNPTSFESGLSNARAIGRHTEDRG